MEIKFQSGSELKEKIKAFQFLFGRTPKIELPYSDNFMKKDGYLCGKPYICKVYASLDDLSQKSISKIGKKWITLNDGTQIHAVEGSYVYFK